MTHEELEELFSPVRNHLNALNNEVKALRAEVDQLLPEENDNETRHHIRPAR